jgi:hypothetical protein
MTASCSAAELPGIVMYEANYTKPILKLHPLFVIGLVDEKNFFLLSNVWEQVCRLGEEWVSFEV